MPDHKALCVGDLVTWVFPNCGNPQKVQRYPLEWAQALREMMTYEAEWLLPAHGLVVRGADRVATVLGDLAAALELLTEETLAMMNAGESLDAIIHQVTVPDDLRVKPRMQPVYDDPEFVVLNLWRLNGGWWDNNPAHLKPAPESVFAAEMAALAGGAAALTARATELAAAGDLRLACQMVELAVQADPESTTAHGARAEIYQQRRNEEFSLMSKGFSPRPLVRVAPSPTSDGSGLRLGRSPVRASPVVCVAVALYVQKFGGTSVGTPDRIREVADHAARCVKRGDQVVLVVSAMGKETDELLRLADDVSTSKPGREMDMLITGGERKACALVAMALTDLGIESESFTGSQAGF